MPDDPRPEEQSPLILDPELQADLDAAAAVVAQRSPEQSRAEQDSALKKITEERDILRKGIIEAEDKISELQVQTELLQEKLNVYETRAHSYGVIAMFNPDDDSVDVYEHGARKRVRIMPTVTRDEIRPGLPCLLAPGSSGLVVVLPELDRTGVKMELVERLDHRTAIVTDGHDHRTAIILGETVAAANPQPGTSVIVSEGVATVVLGSQNPASKITRFMLTSMEEITSEDIGGLDDEIVEITKGIEDPLRYPDAYTALDMPATSHRLLIGLPGNGKTTLAKYIAWLSFQKYRDQILKHTPSNIAITNGTELYTKWLGDTEKFVREIPQALQELHELTGAPMFWIIDDCEALLLTRDHEMASTNINGSIVTQFCSIVDGVRPLKGVSIIATTNRLDRLDHAVADRFNTHVRINPPDSPVRAAAVLRALLRKSAVSDREQVIKKFIDTVFADTPENRILQIFFEDDKEGSESQIITLSQLLSGRLLKSVVRHAKNIAKNRVIEQYRESQPPISAWSITPSDLRRATDEALKNKESLPGTKDTAREWLRQRGDKRTLGRVINLRESRRQLEREEIKTNKNAY